MNIGSIVTPPPLPNTSATASATVHRYVLTRADVLWFHVWAGFRNRFVLGFFVLLTIHFTWSQMGSEPVANRSLGFKIFFAIVFGLISFGFLTGVTAVITLITVVFKKFRGLVGEHELQIREDGLFERTDVNETVHRWGGFHKLVKRSGYLYIYVTDNNVHIVPRKSFPSVQAEQAFCQEIEKHVASCRAVTAK